MYDIYDFTSNYAPSFLLGFIATGLVFYTTSEIAKIEAENKVRELLKIEKNN